MIGPGSAEPVGVSLAGRGIVPGGFLAQGVEVVTVVPGDHVDVQVPHVLVAVRLIVLADGDAAAAVGLPHADSDVLGEVPEGMPDIAWDVVDVLVVFPKDDQHTSWVVRPPLRRDECEDRVSVGDKVGRLVVLVVPSCDDVTHGAAVSVRGMRDRHAAGATAEPVKRVFQANVYDMSTIGL